MVKNALIAAGVVVLLVKLGWVAPGPQAPAAIK